MAQRNGPAIHVHFATPSHLMCTVSGEIDTDTLSAISIYNGVGLVKREGSE
jgi:hypothetical protein